eukprot:CAMPEP_0113590740 /NCGR_PEP_ID=MMETSP0015_2-20120614/36851_1 /TAXON_ID=2838 /ORGANISM="Odontella" /LENGTH=56 /DNA_ID=CAMNT_0000496983 /DNA_START=28 /DNA_END=194 /DNA_ORIENTATION=+ /assembly_acc=CAM_ASM_000160
MASCLERVATSLPPSDGFGLTSMFAAKVWQVTASTSWIFGGQSMSSPEIISGPDKT